MIIFDLDGTLADCEHRQHLINPEFYEDLCENSNYRIIDGQIVVDEDQKCKWRYKKTGEPFQTGWKAFYEACDKDMPIISSFNIFHSLNYTGAFEIQIWSGRCESVKEKTEQWLNSYSIVFALKEIPLKMRPIGNTEPDEVLKGRWLDEIVRENRTVEFVFDDRPKMIRFWRSRGIFVFNCCQHDEEF